MSTRPSASHGYLALRPSMFTRLRAAATTSRFVRALLVCALAISVTVLGVAAGALVVAPIVGTGGTAPRVSTTPTTTVSANTAASNASSANTVSELVRRATSTATRAWQQLDRGTGTLLARLPEPVARYSLPTIAVLSITGALLALFLPTRQSATLATISTKARSTAPRGIAALTPRSTPRIGSRKQTPDAVEALAASGASAPDIAWRTGLPLDAVRLLLAISTTPRQLHPPAA